MLTNRAAARILATVLLATAVLAGCGSSGSDDSSKLGDPIPATSEGPGTSTTTSRPRTTTTTTTSGGSSSPDGPLVPGASVFVDPQGGYTIDVSPAWTTGTSGADVELWFIGTGDAQFNDNLNVLTQDTLGRDLQEYLDFSADNLGGLDLVSYDVVTGTAGQEMGLIEYSGTLPGAPFPLHMLATVVIEDGVAQLATLTTTLATFDQARAEVEPYLLTLRTGATA